jgi:hypothetical protein
LLFTYAVRGKGAFQPSKSKRKPAPARIGSTRVKTGLIQDRFEPELSWTTRALGGHLGVDGQ